MQVHVITAVAAGAVWMAPLQSSAEQQTIPPRSPVTLAETVQLVAKVCRLYVDKDRRDVRAFEERLGRNGSDFSEITNMRLMCELYAQGRDDADRLANRVDKQGNGKNRQP